MRRNLFLVAAAFLMGMTAQAEQPPVADNPLSLGFTRSIQERLSEKTDHLKEALIEMGMPREMYEETYPSHNADTVVIHTWDDNNSEFQPLVRELFSYDDPGRVSEIVREIPGDKGYTPVEKEIFSYHATGKLHQRILQFLQNDEWVNIRKETHLFDEHENLTTEIHSQWSTSSAEWEDYFKYSVTYEYLTDNIVLLVEAYYWSLFIDENLWHPSFREEYSYDDYGRLTEMVFSIPNGDDFIYAQKEEYVYEGENTLFDYTVIYNYDDMWVPEYKVTDFAWYDEALDLPETYKIWINEELDDDWKQHNEVEWLLMQRTTYTYHPTLHAVTEVLDELNFDGDWSGFFRRTTTYNEFDYKVRYVEEYNFSFTGELWEIDDGYWFEGLFDDEGKPLNLTLRLYDWFYEEWQEERMFVFGYGSGDPPTPVIPTDASVQWLAHIYPNPASDLLRISFAQDYHDVSVSIINMSGQKVREVSAAGRTGELAIDVSALQRGIYLLRVQCGYSVQTEKVQLVR